VHSEGKDSDAVVLGVLAACCWFAAVQPPSTTTLAITIGNAEVERVAGKSSCAAA